MPTTNEFWQVAEQVVSERGGLVVGFVADGEQPALGSPLDNVLGFKPPRPLTIVSISDWSDWKEQLEAFYRLRPSWGRGKAGDPHATYYRVKFPEPDATEKSLAGNSITTPSLPSNRLSIPSFSGYAAPVSGLKGATFWIRTLARIIDFILHYCVGFIAGMLFVLLLTVAAGGRPPLWVLLRISRARLPVFVAGLLGSFAYHVISVSVHGSSLGKLLLSLQVVQDDGSRCRPKSAIIRELAYFIDSLFFGLIAYMAMKDSEEHKRYGDNWANTMVCKRSAIPRESRQGAMRFVLGLMLGIFADIAILMVGLLVQMNY